LFKKVVIADNCAEAVNYIFANSASLYGIELFLGAIFFSFQIYGDFSGYSDIAIGTSRLFGFNLMRNFAFPYFSRDIAEFWRRWHISLSTWFRDYLYIPLGGSYGNIAQKIRNTFVIFLVSGFWHGANWTFIVWGTIHALYFLPLLLKSKNRRYLNDIRQDKLFPSFTEFYNIVFTFIGVTIAWVFFRADTLQDAFRFLIHMIQHPGSFLLLSVYAKYITLLIFIPIFLFLEWKGKNAQFAIAELPDKWTKPLRYCFYYAIGALIIWFGDKEVQFIYFQF
jgi:alginate O-acetyltransferase complex protein AlgI